MSKDIGTLKEIGAQVGDVVGLIQWGPVWNENNDFARGKRYTVGEDRVDNGTGYFMIDDAHGGDKIWGIISRANKGPVREVTTRVVPNQCVIGHVEVTKYGKIWMRHVTTADELTAAISTLQTIRDAMQANTTA